ncbi:GD11120 [Drosophila simulans]|uniref:GD11120 n=1 Tax=Drosophila simulans TaxID=7240 RepID=B4QGV3_DROSI|nr:GD11120 [Drosophila simulans]
MALGWSVIILGCIGQLSAQILNYTQPRDLELLEGRLLRVLSRLNLEEEYNTLLVYGKECVFHSLLRKLEIPAVTVLSGSTDYDWSFSTATLVLSCGSDAENEENSYTLLKLQRTRRLIYLDDNSEPESVCMRYSLKEQHNIAMVKSNFDQSDIFYSCRLFQTPNYVEGHFFKDQPIYIENFQNMRGATIRTVPDILVPRTIVYRDEKSGETKMLGYLAHMINTYAQKLNAKLQFIDTEKLGVKKPSVLDIMNWVKEDIVDIGTTLASSLQFKNMDSVWYPYLLTGYCLMVPVPAKMPYNLVYSMIVDPLVLSIIFVMLCLFSVLIIYTQQLSWKNLTLANILLNDKSLRGLLGQSFPFPANPSKHLKLIIFVLCFASVMITTMYEAYLQSYFTQPPSEPYIRSFQDIGNSSLKMAISRMEVNVLTSLNNSHFREISEDHLLIFDDLSEYLVLRDSFNTSFIFPVSVDRWNGYEEQQKLFAEPAFYLATNLCFNQFMLFSPPLRRYLPHRHLFDDHMMRQHEFGLVTFWKSQSFIEMVRLGLASMEDLSKKTNVGLDFLKPSASITEISRMAKDDELDMGIT